MDRQSVIGLTLIGVIFVVWFYLSSYYAAEAPIVKPQTDSLAIIPSKIDSGKITKNVSVESPRVISSDTSWVSFPEKQVSIVTPKYKAVLSSTGGEIVSFETFGYKTTNGNFVQLISDSLKGNLNYQLKLSNGSTLNTRDLSFDFASNSNKLELKNETDSVLVYLTATSKNNQSVKLSYVFHGSGYKIDHSVSLENFDGSASSQNVILEWKNGIRFSEHDLNSENSSAESHIYFDGTNDYLNATSTDEIEELKRDGMFDWTSIRTKYFAVALINSDKKAVSARLYGKTNIDVKGLHREEYNISQNIPYSGEKIFTKKTTIFLTPLEYDYLKSFDMGLQYMMSLGLPYVVKPISEYFILPIFEFLYSFILNWGLVIIAFTIIIKTLLYPLTQSSYKGMKKMQEVAPKMKEIQDKYKDDKEKLQVELLKLYRENGYNPFGGCLPMVLQMPILFALYTVFANAIQLRQSSFLWSPDLSLPDSILHLPFSIPLYGNHVSLWALLMAGSMILQMRMTPQTNKEQAVIMMWVFPVMMLLMFNNLASGLNMYYFLFNVLSVAQQWFYNKRNSTSTLLTVNSK